MSYEESSPKEYALVTPPKDPGEQPLLAAEKPSPAEQPSPIPSGDGSLKLLTQEADEAPFTPTETSTEYPDLEPLPFREDAFGSFSPGNAQTVWQLVNYSPILATPGTNHEGAVNEGVKGFGGIQQSPIEFNEASLTPQSADSKHDAPVAKKPSPQFSRDGTKGSGEKPPPYPHHHPWHQMYPPPPYYWHPYHYGYPPHHDQRRLPPPNLYPKPGQYAHPPPPPYGRYGKPPFGQGHHEEVIKKVSDNDVICGRGGAVNNHAGNRKFRQYIQEHKQMYLSATKQKKPSVAMRVLDTVRKAGGRFLVKASVGPGYLECCHDRAREKASQALREAAAKLRKAGHAAQQSPAEKSAGIGHKRVLLPNELPGAPSLPEPECPSAFEPPHNPPRKKIKQEAV